MVDSGGHETSVVDSGGHRTSVVNSSGHRTSVVDSGGHQLTKIYKWKTEGCSLWRVTKQNPKQL